MKQCLVVAALVLALLAASIARAQTSDASIVVRVDAGNSGLDPSAVRDAIARELRISVESAESDSTRAQIEVRVSEQSITVVYTEAGGQPLTRVVERPEDRSEELEVIALLAGNLARDEARELADVLGPKPVPPVQPAPPKPPPVERTAPAPAATAADEPPIYFNLSLFHPVALYRDSHLRLVHGELGLVYGRIGRLEGVAFDVGLARVDGLARGVVFGGIWSRADGGVDGAAVSGIFSTSRGRLRGADASGVFNWRDGDVLGGQASGVFNRAGNVDGGQASGVANRAERVRGGQVTGALNLAGDVAGFQSAVVNVGGNVDGVQLGVLNIGQRVRGAQIGLVNIADRVDGLSFAPVSILRDNRTHALLWSDTTLIANAGVKYATDPLYTLFSFGIDPAPESQQAIGFGAGIGGQLLGLDPLFLDADLLYRYILPRSDQDGYDDVHSTSYRAVVRWRLGELVTLFAAGGVEHRVDDEHRALPYGAAGAQFF